MSGARRLRHNLQQLALARALLGVFQSGCNLLALLGARFTVTTPLRLFQTVDAPSTHVQSPLFDRKTVKPWRSVCKTQTRCHWCSLTSSCKAERNGAPYRLLLVEW